MEGQAVIAWKLPACFLLSQQMNVKTVNQTEFVAATCFIDYRDVIQQFLRINQKRIDCRDTKICWFILKMITLLPTCLKRFRPEPQNMARRFFFHFFIPIADKVSFLMIVLVIKKFCFSKEVGGYFARQFVPEAKHAVMKEAVHWEVRRGLCFSLYLAHCHSIPSHLAHHQTSMKTSKWYLKSKVLGVFFLKCHCCFTSASSVWQRNSQDARWKKKSLDVIRLLCI